MSEKENAFTRDELIELLDDPETPRISTGTVRELIRSLLAEMDKPGDVWKDAPENAIRSLTYFYDANRAYISEIERTRTLPKSRARVIAEEARSRYERGSVGAGSLDDVIESAILKALAENEAGKC